MRCSETASQFPFVFQVTYNIDCIRKLVAANETDDSLKYDHNKSYEKVYLIKSDFHSVY